jgi:hypothetical protein
MFSVGLHLMGRFFSGLTPSPLGPRQPGQFADTIAALLKKVTIKTSARIRRSTLHLR